MFLLLCNDLELERYSPLLLLPNIRGQTWAGNWYNFHGECDLVFLTTQRSGLGPLDIYIRTKVRHKRAE